MSTTKRLISGSAAAWARIGVTMLTQLALVPVFLTYWNVKTFGIWLAIQALVTILATLDKGFNDFLLYEFLKLGPNKRVEISTMLWSAVLTLGIVSIVEIIVVLFLGFHLNIESLLGESKIENGALRNQIAWSLIFEWGVWMLNNMAGLFFRSLCTFGYYPRMGWWYVISGIVSSTTAVIAVTFGANLAMVSGLSLVGTLAVVLVQSFDIKRILREEQLSFMKVSLKEGFKSYTTSLGLSGRYFLENFRQQGVRLLLAPLSGASGLTAFTTMRTGANVALQGLNTITNPLMPELMRFLREKEQKKMDAVFDSVWLVLVAGLTPGVIILQAIAPTLFAVWTKGQIAFDPYLFATLSLCVLIYAWGQPASAIVTGNNLLWVQLVISAISAVIIIGGMILLFPSLSILGAGVSLMVAEIAVAGWYQYYARKWLHSQSLAWPEKSARLSSFSVIIATISMVLMSVFHVYIWEILIASALLMFWNLSSYWKNMPLIAIEKANAVISKIPVIGKMVKSIAP